MGREGAEATGPPLPAPLPLLVPAAAAETGEAEEKDMSRAVDQEPCVREMNDVAMWERRLAMQVGIKYRMIQAYRLCCIGGK